MSRKFHFSDSHVHVRPSLARVARSIKRGPKPARLEGGVIKPATRCCDCKVARDPNGEYRIISPPNGYGLCEVVLCATCLDSPRWGWLLSPEKKKRPPGKRQGAAKLKEINT